MHALGSQAHLMAKKRQRKKNQREGKAPEHGGVVPSLPAHEAPLGSCTPTWHKCPSLTFFLSSHFLGDKSTKNHLYKFFWSANKISSKESEMFTVFPLHPYRARQLSFAVYRAHPCRQSVGAWRWDGGSPHPKDLQGK